jgi:enoyl-CoA hydratase/carnithine racemase
VTFITVARAGHVTTVTLARPEVLNAINPAMHDELEAAFNAFAADPEQYICVITGEGRGFCAGSDLKQAVADVASIEVTRRTAMRNQANYPAFAAWRSSEDARDDPQAFAEKRTPVWKGC